MASYENIEEEESEELLGTPLRSSGALPVMNMPVAVVGENTYPVVLANLVKGTMPVQRGGTGLNDLDGGKLIASSENGIMLEEIDVPVSHFAGLSANIEERLKKVRSYNVAIPTTGWSVASGAGDGFQQTISVPGMTSSDNPVVGLNSAATTTSALEAERRAYDCIDRIDTGNDSITVYCFKTAPTTSFSIRIQCNGS